MRQHNITIQKSQQSSPTLTPAPTNLLQRKCACGSHSIAGSTCSACAEKNQPLQRKSPEINQAPAVPYSVQDVLASPGRPLDVPARSFMEQRFGQDFSRVRVHADAPAAESARAVNAHAYTVGNHIVFGTSQYAPETGRGGHLLAHELTHVVQQGVSGRPVSQSAKAISNSSDAAEVEADFVANQIMSGGHVTVTQQPSATVHTLSDETAKGLGIGAGILGGIGLGFGIAALAGAFSGKKKKCPTTHTIPDDTYDAITEAWGKSGHGEEAVTEHGGRIVTAKDDKRVIRTGSGGGGSISLPAEEAGDTTLGTFHTHPYSKAEGSTIGVSFSGGDITNFIAGGQGNVKYIGAGSCNYVLDTQDVAARDSCQKVDVTQRWNDAFAAAGGNFQSKVETAVNAAIAGCGLCYYKACRADEKSAIPKAASLI